MFSTFVVHYLSISAYTFSRIYTNENRFFFKVRFTIPEYLSQSIVTTKIKIYFFTSYYSTKPHSLLPIDSGTYPLRAFFVLSILVYELYIESWMKYEEKLLLERSFLVMKLLHLLLISSLPFQTETLKKWFIYIWFPSPLHSLGPKEQIKNPRHSYINTH